MPASASTTTRRTRPTDLFDQVKIRPIRRRVSARAGDEGALSVTAARLSFFTM
jgi:hypothetical protein